MTATPFVEAAWSQPSGVWSMLVEGPTEEPLTVTEAKLRAGLDSVWPDGDPRDALMLDFIRAARAQVEHDTGLALLKQTRDVTWAGVAPGDIVPLPSQASPVISFELVPVDPAKTAARVIVPRFYQPGVVQTVANPGATLRIVAGWPDVAALRAEAPSLIHAVGLLTAHYATSGRDLVTIGETASRQEARTMPMGYEDAIGPHRLVWVT